MEKGYDSDVAMLQEAVDTGATVKIIFTNGFQTFAKIVDFGHGVIVAQVGDKRWTIYCHAVSTIVMT